MSIQQHAVRYAQRRVGSHLSRRFARSIPWFGTALALLFIGSAIRRKGIVGGTVDTALNAIPLVGGVKNVAEVMRGRDFIRDRRVARRT